jgi:hypothetical protein
MKTDESKFQKCHVALLRHGRRVWVLFKKRVHSHPRGGDVKPNAVPEVPSAPSTNTLDRIAEHLRGLGLGKQVRVRFEDANGYFVLEDADGFVHARDYLEAVVVIERIWLYQP